jgi:hypothetical protein
MTLSVEKKKLYRVSYVPEVAQRRCAPIFFHQARKFLHMRVLCHMVRLDYIDRRVKVLRLLACRIETDSLDEPLQFAVRMHRFPCNYIPVLHAVIEAA